MDVQVRASHWARNYTAETKQNQSRCRYNSLESIRPNELIIELDFWSFCVTPKRNERVNQHLDYWVTHDNLTHAKCLFVTSPNRKKKKDGKFHRLVLSCGKNRINQMRKKKNCRFAKTFLCSKLSIVVSGGVEEWTDEGKALETKWRRTMSTCHPAWLEKFQFCICDGCTCALGNYGQTQHICMSHFTRGHTLTHVHSIAE